MMQTEAGIALESMEEWFKNHKIWILKQHKKIGHNTIQKLVKNGLIFHVGFGMYSLTPDVNVYDVVTERYLRDGNGTIVGHFIGDTADYLSGQREEPDVITLESSVIKRTKKRTQRTYSICGRTVVIKGTK